MKINNKDLLWNYFATFFKISSSILLLPLILTIMSSEEVGIWSVFVTITSFVNLLDFGFNPSFARNISYIYSGVRQLKSKGVEINQSNDEIDHYLLKELIYSMKKFYRYIAILVALLLGFVGSYYLSKVIVNYHGPKNEIYIAWIILCLINIYKLSTKYYESLLMGRGMIKKSKQISVLGNIAYIGCAYLLLLLDMGLIAIVSAQAISVISIRILSHKVFYNKELKMILDRIDVKKSNSVFNAILPNAMKVGLTSLGAFLVLKSTIIIGSLFLSLEEIATYGITSQVIDVIAAVGYVFISTFIPKLSYFRIKNDLWNIKVIYITSIVILLLSYLISGSALILFLPSILRVIGSDTQLLSNNLIILFLVISFLETNHGIASIIILSKNEVPFFKASIISGLFTVIFLFILLRFTELGLVALIIAPGLIQLSYQNWKWPYETIKELKIKSNEIISILKSINKITAE